VRKRRIIASSDDVQGARFGAQSAPPKSNAESGFFWPGSAKLRRIYLRRRSFQPFLHFPCLD